MLRIAVCDDNSEDLSNITSMIDEYSFTLGESHTIIYTIFHNAADLIAAMEQGQNFELVLLDILMPFMTGMNAAKEIRQFNTSVFLIFLTSSPEFAIESYSVDAFYYALKPIIKQQLFQLLDKVLFELEEQEGTSLLIKTKIGLSRVYLKRIEFAEIIGRTICYHLINGSVMETIGTMQELEVKLLPHSCFVKPHRSYIINMDYIQTLKQHKIVMNSLTSIPLPKANYQTVKSAYLSYAFQNFQHMEKR